MVRCRFAPSARNLEKFSSAGGNRLIDAMRSLIARKASCPDCSVVVLTVTLFFGQAGGSAGQALALDVGSNTDRSQLRYQAFTYPGFTRSGHTMHDQQRGHGLYQKAVPDP